MKSKDDYFTSEMFGERRPGRPRKLNPKNGAQRVREHRARKSAISVTRNEICSLCGGQSSNCTGVCRVGQLGHLSAA